MERKDRLMEIPVKKIGEFVKGERVEGFFLLKSVTLKTTNSGGKKYLDLVLSDKTGDILGKVWEIKPEHEELKSNTVFKIRGTVNSWQGTLQLKVEHASKVTEEDNINLDDFVQSAPYTSDEMFKTIKDTVDNMNDVDIKNILNRVLELNKDKLMYYPAAKSNHHSIKGGLLYHITTMLKLAENICGIYDFLNRDLVYAGVILHDMAKIKEMSSNEMGIVDEYTLEGTLLGHITQGIKEIEVIGKEVNADSKIIMLLQHMVLSHHYEPEYGSPVKPLIPEAEMLHYLDVMDARMYDMKKAINETKENEFSERIWSLDSRRIYNHGMHEKNN